MVRLRFQTSEEAESPEQFCAEIAESWQRHTDCRQAADSSPLFQQVAATSMPAKNVGAQPRKKQEPLLPEVVPVCHLDATADMALAPERLLDRTASAQDDYAIQKAHRQESGDVSHLDTGLYIYFLRLLLQ